MLEIEHLAYHPRANRAHKLPALGLAWRQLCSTRSLLWRGGHLYGACSQWRALTQPTAGRDMMNPPPSRCGDAATTTTHRALAVSRFYFPITPTNSTFLFVYKRRERELGAPRFLSPPKGEDRNSRERGREAEGKQGRIRNLAGGAG